MDVPNIKDKLVNWNH